ncbi:MAG TPA: glycerol-3-phosphate 1-O-acyltransferase PlsY [Candidatus Atopostipes pullistercoris]|uniref:Glycerol-3-phosphate acyltransferase n=1 Tax=Candidatus Atopostipes pullistercoris TaxID=2838467 RepID=A0A9D2JXM8_9LACT|nr:glycerol-3-phosphate 1-O-acyltransferase PlsY [Candidatus Atopostipes pullistercoris]
MNILFLMIIAYLLGSIPSGVWIGKLLYHKDIREYGSGNTGATNTFRILGVKAGTIALIIDVMKGVVATYLPIWLGSDIHPIFIGVFAILGHVFPLYIKFKGGKAVATSAGVALALHPIFLLIFVGVFLIILFTTSIVSISSILAVLFAAIGSFFLNDPIFTIVIWFVAFLIVYLHRENIKRLKNGTESRVPFGLRSSKKDN